MTIRTRLRDIEGILGDDEACHGCGHPGRTVQAHAIDMLDIDHRCPACGRLIDNDGRPRTGACIIIAGERDRVQLTNEDIELQGVPVVKIMRREDIDAAS